MGAPVKFLFEDDFTAGNDRRARPTVPLAQHEAALAQAHANGMLAAEGKIEARAAKMLVDDMQAMGPVRLRDVDESQALLVNLAKDLAAKGEIMISKSRGDEELVY